MIALHISFERRWRGLGKAEQAVVKEGGAVVHVLLLVVVSAGIFLGWYWLKRFGFLECGSHDRAFFLGVGDRNYAAAG